MATVLLAGASGLIGNALVTRLSKSHTIHILTRNKSLDSQINSFYWNPQTGEIDANAFNNVSCVINLSGENISNSRWSKKQKVKIQESRTQTSKVLLDSIVQFGSKVTTYISASAVGFYGSETSEKIYSEIDLPGTGFLAETCVKWELSALRRIDVNVRKVFVRTSIVLSNKGGVVQKIKQTLPLRFLTIFGSGKQYLPWIHIEDLCAIYEFAIENEQLSGIYNAVSSEHCTNSEFVSTLKSILPFKTIIIKIPAFVLQFLFGEMASILIKGSRVSNQKVVNAGFIFTHNTLQKALINN